MFLADFRCASGHEREVLLARRDAVPDPEDVCRICGGPLTERVNAIDSFCAREREFAAVRARFPLGFGLKLDGRTRYFGGGMRGGSGRDLPARNPRPEPRIVGTFVPTESMRRDAERNHARAREAGR